MQTAAENVMAVLRAVCTGCVRAACQARVYQFTGYAVNVTEIMCRSKILKFLLSIIRPNSTANCHQQWRHHFKQQQRSEELLIIKHADAGDVTLRKIWIREQQSSYWNFRHCARVPKLS
jgi:hypothetical protein